MHWLVGVCFLRAKKLGFSSGKATAKALFDTTCQTAIAGTALSILGIGLAKNPTGIFHRVIDSRKGIMWQVEASRVKVFSAQADNIIASVFIVALLSVVLTVKKTNELVGRVTYLSTTCALTRYFIYSMRYVNPKSEPNFFQSLLCYTIGEDFGSLYNYNYDSKCHESKKSHCLKMLSCALGNKFSEEYSVFSSKFITGPDSRNDSSSDTISVLPRWLFDLLEKAPY